MNASEPLPITMPYDKYKEGTRDAIQFFDKKVQGYTDIKEIFHFISSDDSAYKVQLQNGESVNYLPTKSFSMKVNPDEVIKQGVVAADEKGRLADTIRWKYTSNFVTKDNLAFIDILAHNDWKRPICFTITVGQDNMMGLQPYLYKEGFTYHLIPFKADTAIRDQLGKTHTMVMYNNIMTKFKWGNFKNAKYLDPESTTMFYPVLLSTILDLSQNLQIDGHKDLAVKVLHKYDQEMPDIYPDMNTARNKYFLVANAYGLGDVVFANKFVNSIDNYLTDQLDYNYSVLQGSPENVDDRTVQLGLSLLNGLASIAKENRQTALASKLEAQMKSYEGKFASLIGKQ